MKTAAYVAHWCIGAEQEFGDASAAVCQLFFRFQEVAGAPGEDLVCRLDSEHLVIALGPGVDIPLPVQFGPAEIGASGELDSFGLEQIAPGLWALTPSLNIPGVIHAFIVLYGVPDPAPWERRIVVASRIEVPA